MSAVLTGRDRGRRVLSLLAAFVLVVAGLVAAAVDRAEAATGPGTIAFIKAHNVWVSNPDGTGQRQLTSNGTASAPWHSPDQSDVGTVVAARGSLIHRMDQWGADLTVIDPPDLNNAAGEVVGGYVQRTTISPDGSKITYTYENYSCPPRNEPCRLRHTTGFTAADRLTPANQLGVAFLDHPTWLTNSRLMFNGIGYDQMHLFDVGRGPLFWFHEGMYPGSDFKTLADGAVSRNGALMATVRGEFEDTRIRTYTLPRSPREGGVPPLPEPVCETSTSDGLASPTFAPDSSAVAWEEPDGIWIKNAPADCSVQQTLVIAGASEPSWSAAALQTTRPPAPPKPPGPDTPVPAPSSFTLAKKPAISGVAKAGRKLRVSAGRWSPRPASVSYRWYRNGRAISGATKSTYKVRAGDRSKKLSVKVTVRRAGVMPRSLTTKSVKVRR